VQNPGSKDTQVSGSDAQAFEEMQPAENSGLLEMKTTKE